jgi:flagellin
MAGFRLPGPASLHDSAFEIGDQMSLYLNSDTSALNISRNLFNAQRSTELAMERLSSGRRLNSAKDDASGVGISYRLDSQIRGTEMSARNAQDAISAAQIADAALTEIQSIAVRIRELTVQKASDQFSVSDKQNVQTEIDQLNAEILRIKSDTKFNTKLVSGLNFETVLSGTSTTVSLQFPVFPSTAGDTSALADQALQDIATARATLGAYVNRLEHASNNLYSISLNTQTALSRVVDADLAKESATLAKSKVLQQTASSMIAQANATNEYILNLLQ